MTGEAMSEGFAVRARLQGFGGEWETKRLSEVAVVRMGQSPPRRPISGCPSLTPTRKTTTRMTPESQNVEWKSSWRDEHLKWICGFANAQGGILEIGRNDCGEVVGVSDA